MQEIGKLLRERREQLGLSLADVQAQLKIRVRYLEALEAGNLESFPAPVFLKGFLRAYANFLGLDGMALVAQLRADVDAPEAAPGAGEEPPHVGQQPWLARGWPVIIGGAVVVLGAAWLLWQSGSAPGQSAQRQTTATTNSVTNNGASSTPPANLSTSPKAPTPANVQVQRRQTGENITYAVATPLPLQVTIHALDICWVHVESDGRVIFEGFLQRGQTASWQAEQRLFVRAGAPDILRITVDGIDLGQPDTAGPRNLIFVKPGGA